MTEKKRALQVLGKIERMVKSFVIPFENEISREKANPFQILTGIILSARTKDSTTAKVVSRLFQVMKTPADLHELSRQKLESIIRPAGFFRSKARSLHRLANVLLGSPGIPGTREALLKLPGVGRKTAALFLSRVYHKPAVCVDTHVFRISNRILFAHKVSRTPLETENRLMELFPERLWSRLNTLLVKFGQNICLPVGPRCHVCLVRRQCAYYRDLTRAKPRTLLKNTK
jgi:endonuclease III